MSTAAEAWDEGYQAGLWAAPTDTRQPANPYREGSPEPLVLEDVPAWEFGALVVLEEIMDERRRQVARYGHNEQLEDGTGPDVDWLWPFTALQPVPATDVERGFRRAYERHEKKHGAPTWRHLVLEEVAESFQESDPLTLESELVQVAALCCSWVEKLRARRTP